MTIPKTKRVVKEIASGFQPKHIPVKDNKFCDFGCVIVDGVKVPFPDCQSHGSPFDNNRKCGTIDFCP